MVLNADQMKLESIWELLRGAAAAAGPNTNLYAEIIEVINDMKHDSASHCLTAFKAWIMVSCLANRDITTPGTNSIMNNFMVNLKRFYALEYVLVPTRKAADAALFQCEKRYNWDMLLRSRDKPKGLCPVVENKSMLRNKSNDRAAMVFEVNANGKGLKQICYM